MCIASSSASGFSEPAVLDVVAERQDHRHYLCCLGFPPLCATGHPSLDIQMCEIFQHLDMLVRTTCGVL